MADIFLSYAREDDVVAKRLSERLESLGWSVWWDREIPAGRTWREVIEKALAHMGCMIVLWSKQSIHSDWVKEEADEGQAKHRLVPVLIDDVKPPMGFRGIQAADLIGWDGSKDFPGFAQLIEALEAHIGKPVIHSTANPALERRQNSPDRFDFSKLFHFANRLPWWSVATATVLITLLIAASIDRGDRNRQRPSAVSLPVKNLNAGEMRLSLPLTIRGPVPTPPSETAHQARALTPALGKAREPKAENPVARKLDATRPKSTPAPTTATTRYPCSEILARAQLGEPLSDGDREALRKECPS